MSCPACVSLHGTQASPSQFSSQAGRCCVQSLLSTLPCRLLFFSQHCKQCLILPSNPPIRRQSANRISASHGSQRGRLLANRTVPFRTVAPLFKVLLPCYRNPISRKRRLFELHPLLSLPFQRVSPTSSLSFFSLPVPTSLSLSSARPLRFYCERKAVSDCLPNQA